jgi:hypothetical protein
MLEHWNTGILSYSNEFILKYSILPFFPRYASLSGLFDFGNLFHFVHKLPVLLTLFHYSILY